MMTDLPPTRGERTICAPDGDKTQWPSRNVVKPASGRSTRSTRPLLGTRSSYATAAPPRRLTKMRAGQGSVTETVPGGVTSLPLMAVAEKPRGEGAGSLLQLPPAADFNAVPPEREGEETSQPDKGRSHPVRVRARAGLVAEKS